jgi:hypothetical protein
MRHGLVLFVLAVVAFVKVTGGCEPMPVCERPNDLQACGEHPHVTTPTTTNEHRGGAGANQVAVPVPSNPSKGGS